MGLRERLRAVPKAEKSARGSQAVTWFMAHWEEIVEIRAEDATASWEGFAVLMRDDGVTYPARAGKPSRPADARLARQAFWRVKERKAKEAKGQAPPEAAPPPPPPMTEAPEVLGTAPQGEKAKTVRSRLGRIGS